AELKSVGPARPATSGIFPFGFRRQSKAHFGAVRLTRHFRNNCAGVNPTEKPVGTSDIMPRYILDRPAVAVKVRSIAAGSHHVRPQGLGHWNGAHEEMRNIDGSLWLFFSEQK